MDLNQQFWKNKRVFVTGHNGFKGTWLTIILESLGAKVFGYALDPNTNPSFYNSIQNNLNIISTKGDIRNYDDLKQAIYSADPEIIIHMAAQPLVRLSYDHPVETYSTNVMGLVNLLDIAKNSKSLKSILNITSDKCYENNEWHWGYRESDRLGGFDPYSNSKACAELVTASFRSSYFNKLNVGVATARAGNVIGGGDWSEDRLVPDVIRAWQSHEKLTIRSPNAVRPWQHVLEPLMGYLLLAENLFNDPIQFSGAWNFGPDDRDVISVQTLINQIKNNLPDKLLVEFHEDHSKHEASLLKLDCSKVRNTLNWKSRWDSNEAVKKTVDWYCNFYNKPNSIKEFTLSQLNNYLN